MKVAVFTEVGRLAIEERDKPGIGPGEALLEVAYCGICGSDVHAYKSGLIYPTGTVMGHEFSGSVVEVGEGVQAVQVGDRVVGIPFAPCGTCYFCLRGAYNHCANAITTAIGLSTQVDGAFAEYVRIPVADRMLIKLPESLSLEDAALCEPLATPVRAVKESGFKPGHRAVVLGAGPIGLGVVQILRMAGASRIVVVEKSEARCAAASRLGADEVLNPEREGEELVPKIAGLNDGVGADVVFECAGVPETFSLAPRLVKSGGQVMLVGIIEEEVSIVPLELAVREIGIKGILGYELDDFLCALEYLAARRIGTGVMISRVVPLEEIEEKGFQRLLSSPEQVKILVRP